jgi:hypothetical protein
MIAAKSSNEAVLAALRRAGYSKIESIMALVDLGRAAFGDAKVIVHESEVWKDVRSRDEEVQRALLGKPEDPESTE